MRIALFFSNYSLSKRTNPIFFRIIQDTNFDMGFQKINIIDRYKKLYIFFWVSLKQSYLNEPKQFFNKLPPWDFIILKLQLLFYIKIQKTKNFGVLANKNFFFTIGPSNPP
jgi:hypothetical protein